MSNLSLSFTVSPWLMLLIVAAAAATLIPYFRLAKRYRRTRNRIISITLHLIVSVLCISVLAGLQFTYETPNNENRMIILVDASYSAENKIKSRDMFVNELISDSERYNCKIGIVAFGFDQELVAEPTTDISALKNKYKDFQDKGNMPDCDIDATDIAAAFRYAEKLIDNPQTSKVVLVSDGKETDESALSYIRTLTAKGVKIDVVKPYEEDVYDNKGEVQVCDVTFPQDYITLNTETTISVNVKSKTDASVTVKIYDNAARGAAVTPDINQVEQLKEGEQQLTFKHVFKDQSFHEVRVELTVGNSVQEATSRNNEFTTYLMIEKFDKLLIVETYEGTSENLSSLLSADNAKVANLLENPFEYDVTTVVIGSPEFDEAASDLESFDQVILNNVANKDMPDWFKADLKEFVSEYGGGLLTVGGNDPEGNVHVYDREDLGDLKDTTYQDMLPISAVNYTPPMGVAFIIDVSGSMSGDKLEYAKVGLESAVRYSLTDRDYVAIFTLDTTYGQVLPLTPRSNLTTIVNAIHRIGGTGGTIATNAITRAAQALNANSDISRKHIIMLTDGMFGDKEVEGEEPPYIKEARMQYTNNGVTLSVIGIDMQANSEYYIKCSQMTDAAGGKTYTINNDEEIGKRIASDLALGEIGAEVKGVFVPVVNRATDPVMNGVETKTETEDGEQVASRKLDFALGAFYGGRIKKNATLVIADNYRSPIYAYWSYGKGKVGSFMSDLKGTDDSYSKSDFGDSGKGIFASKSGQQLIYGIVRELMPDTRMIAGEVNAKLTEDNYINTLNVYKDDSEQLEAYITKENSTSFGQVSLLKNSADTTAAVYVTSAFGEDNLFGRCTFVVREAGVYKITLKVTDKDGNVRTTEIYKSFSYSAEYDMFADNESAAEKLLNDIATRGSGQVITTAKGLNSVFDNFDPYIHHVFDPRVLFIVVSIIAFLLDIAVRKFKFKWIHEIIRESKENKKVQ